MNENVHIPSFTGKQTRELIEASEQVALRFCAPVYLVGSATHSVFPNDVDIFIAVSSESYLRLFTNYNRKTESEQDHLKNIDAMKIQQAKIYKKQKDYFESRIKGWDFDVKFQNIEQFKQHKDKKVRLDYIYKEVW